MERKRERAKADKRQNLCKSRRARGRWARRRGAKAADDSRRKLRTGCRAGENQLFFVFQTQRRKAKGKTEQERDKKRIAPFICLR